MITIPNPNSPNASVDIYLGMQRDTKCSVQLINNSPYIKIDAFLEGHITSANESSDYSSVETLKDLSDASNKYLSNQISSYLYKTAKDFKSDINGFGKYAVKNYLTWDEWIASNWLENYQSSFFDVNVTVNIKSGELFSKM